MTLEITSKEILEKIVERGYWRVLIRPLIYTEEKFTLSQCEKKVVDAEVRKRGRYYPHISSRHEIIFHDKYVESYVNFDIHTELWRLYRTGQFFHVFSCLEDGERGLKIFAPERIIAVPGYGLSILMTINTIFEIYEFASRLCKEDYENGIQIKIKLNGMKDRRLVTLDFRRTIYTHICPDDLIIIERKLGYNDLVANKKKYVIDDVVEIFQRFNWKEPNIKMIEEEFDKFEK